MRISALTAALAAGLLLAGCAGTSGVLTPGTTAAPLGNDVPAAPPPGSISAGIVGTTIGLGLPPQDLQRALSAEYQALEFGVAGVPVVWRGTVASGEVTPGPIYTVNEYQCRDYTHSIMVGGAAEVARNTSCSRAGAAWAPVA